MNVDINLESSELNLVLEVLNLYREAETERLAKNQAIYEMGMVAIEVAKNPHINISEKSKSVAAEVERMAPLYLQAIQQSVREVEILQVLLQRITPADWESEWKKQEAAIETPVNLNAESFNA